MTVDCMIEDPRWTVAGLEDLAGIATAAVFDHLDLQGFEVCIMGCDDARIAVLNADFRDKPQPTNVLSWPSDERGATTDGAPPAPPDQTDPELGDIAISYDTCALEAREAGKTMADHTTHLVVHGMLHLLGYDHVRDADATLMEGLEIQILGKLGLADPYRDDRSHLDG
jgi:probable rRNA maturation factor